MILCYTVLIRKRKIFLTEENKMIALNRQTVKDKIYACWLGKNIGGTMGTPYEGRTEMQDIQGFKTEPGVVLPNDDLDLQLVWLKAIENEGPYTLNEQILGEYWVSFIPPHWNEYGICKNNMSVGLIPPLSGNYENIWKHSNGAWIRTEVWACMAPGCPDIAMKYARMDACVDHGDGEGTYAAMFVAAIEAAAFVIHDLRKLIDLGLSKIPADCHMARTIKVLLDCKDNGVGWKEARQLIVEDCADLGWFQAPANVAFAMLGLLYGEGDFKQSMIYAIDCGDDTDCTGATLGSIFGILNGTAGIPKDWSAYLGDNIVSVAIDRGTLYGVPTTCTALTDRVFNMIPVMLKANNANVYLSDNDNIPEGDIEKYWNNSVANSLVAIPGNSVLTDFIWGECRVIYPEDPVLSADGNVKLKLVIRNKVNKLGNIPHQISLKWHLPEGWTVSGTKQNYVLQHQNRYNKPELVIECVVTAGTEVSATNRLILEITAPSRPTAGLVPVVILG